MSYCVTDVSYCVTDDFGQATAGKFERLLTVEPEFVIERTRFWAIPGEKVFYDFKDAEIARVSVNGRSQVEVAQEIQGLVCEDLFAHLRHMEEKNRLPYMTLYTVGLVGFEEDLYANVVFNEELAKADNPETAARLLIEKALFEAELEPENPDLEIEDGACGLFPHLWKIWGPDENQGRGSAPPLWTLERH